MTAMFLRSLLPAGVLATILAAPAQAAPVLTTPLKPCYLVAQESQREPIRVQASGFTPFNDVSVFIDDIFQTSTMVLVGGNIDGSVDAPYQEEGTGSFVLRLSEAQVPANTLTVTAMVTRLAVEQAPQRASTGQRVRFKGRGFMAGGAVYAHYVFAGKVRRTIRLGLPKGPCGTFDVRRTQFPFKRSPRVGVWTIQFDQLPHYDPKAAVRVPMTIRVRKTAKQESAQAR